MSLVELRQAHRSEAVSGGNMDKVVERLVFEEVDSSAQAFDQLATGGADYSLLRPPLDRLDEAEPASPVRVRVIPSAGRDDNGVPRDDPLTLGRARQELPRPGPEFLRGRVVWSATRSATAFSGSSRNSRAISASSKP